MGRKKKVVESTDETVDLTEEETELADLETEVEPSTELRNALVLAGPSARERQLELQLAEVGGELLATQDQLRTLKSQPAAGGLTQEQKEALKFALEWLNDLSRRSRSVPFRRQAKSSIALLGTLLA